MITKTAVIGSGYMGGGVAQILALAGCTVQIADVSAEIAESNLKRIIAEAAEFKQAGLFAAGSTEIVRTTFGFRLPFFGRFATPTILKDLVDAGKLGTKSGAGFLDVPAERIPALIAYRNKAYVKMQQLLDELGPAPIN